MNYIKIDTINSTNEFLKSYSQTKDLPNFFYVITDLQTQGKGQRSNIWQSECCKNILISFYLKPDFSPAKQYLLNQIVSLSILAVLQKFNIPDVQIKLPNDILSGKKKISGILIENKIQHNKIIQSIIGIGLNVNQTDFVNLPDAVSMKMRTGTDYDKDTIVESLLDNLKKYHRTEPELLDELFNKYLITNAK